MHAALECRLNILDSAVSVERYFGILRHLVGFYSPLEARIPAYHEDSSLWMNVDRRKVPKLRADLQFSGLSNEVIAALPLCGDLPNVDGMFRQIGCMYVLEGSTLGGQVVVQHLRPRFNLDTRGTEFFSSYGHQVGLNWRAFCSKLEQLETSPTTTNLVVEAACQTFSSLDRWLAHCEGPRQ